MAETYQEQSSDIESDNYRKDVRLQTAMAKAMELRTLHAALMNGRNSHVLGPGFFQGSSSPGYYTHVRQSSSQDYPVFNPVRSNILETHAHNKPSQSYETEPLPGYKQMLLENPIYKEAWEFHEQRNVDEILESMNFEPHISPTVPGQMSTTHSRYTKSRRNSSGNVTMSASSCNKYEPDTTVRDYKPTHRRLMSLSWLFPGLKKKKKINKNEKPHIHSKDSEIDDESTKSLKKELAEALRSRDMALNQVAEMKSSVMELSEKLEYLETYCDELKKALAREKPVNFLSREKSLDSVKHEAMIEDLLRVVSESRLSVKQLCKTLLQQTEGTNHGLVDSLNSLLHTYNISLTSKHRKTILYHVEAVINQSLFQDFENRAFHKSGTPKYLDPREDQVNKYESFIELRDLNWNAILRKGSKHYNAEFSKFCDWKMSDVIATLGSMTWPWGEELVGAFYKAAKCVWLVHLLVFSFDPALVIMRVNENRVFDGRYMEDMFEDRRRSNEARRVKVMVMPGFYVRDRVVRCKVLCRYKSVAS